MARTPTNPPIHYGYTADATSSKPETRDPPANPLAPTDLSEFIGQSRLIDRMKIHIRASLAGDRPLEHILLTAVPGAGKTTLARLIAREMCIPLTELMMPADPKELEYALSTPGAIILADEIHRCSKRQQEDLLPLVGERWIQTKYGRLDCPEITLIAATTEPDKIIPPLWDRFRIKPPFDEYEDSELAQIVEGMARRSGIDLDKETCMLFGQAAAGVPRNAAQLIVATRDLRDATGQLPAAEEVLDLCQMSADGLSRVQWDLLNHLIALGGKAGLQTLSAMLRLHPTVVVNEERLLLRRGLLRYTQGGRELTPAGVRRVKDV